jgi:tetratricopeptide (TPR) repeat protein
LKCRLVLAFAMLLVAGPHPATAADTGPTLDAVQRYEACMTLARQVPDQGFDVAKAWEAEGGGRPARHCAAVAMIGQRKFTEAAVELEKAANEISPTNRALAADLFAQAGQAWGLADDADRSYAAQTRGLKLDPSNFELMVDRGLTQFFQKRYWEALDDFNEAHALAPQRPDIVLYMARAYIYLEEYDLALQLVDEAVALEPDNPDALLQRGLLRRLKHDDAGALADWGKVVQMAPNTPAGDAARKNIEELNATD